MARTQQRPVIVNSAELIEEQFQVTEAQQLELATLYEDLSNRFKVGNLLKGRIIAKDNGGIVVSIDYKSDGFIPSNEFTDFELERITPNAEVEVLLDRLEDENGSVVLSYQKAKALRAWDTITELAEKDEPVRGMVTHKVKGGLNVDVGIPAFLPGSQIDTQRVTDFDQFVGQEVTCKILKVNRKRGNIIISRRKYLEEQRSEDKKKALELINDGQVLQGIVKNITSYGVFVDVGGIDGLLHITDMSWGRIAHPSELVKIGDTITVKVIAFDKKHEKISLGMKQLTPNPWENVDQKYAINTKLTGRVSSITDYGLFIEVEKGIEGLVHISEISWTERINNLGKYFSVNNEIEAVVVGLDKDNRRMSLSIKQLREDPWKAVAASFKIGDKIKGKISNITDFGLFVQLMDGVDGLVHISDLSWTDHVSHPGDKYKKGDEVEAVILGIDAENRKVSLGIKQLEKDPWTSIASEYTVGSTVEGTVSKITNFGAFVKLNNGIEGLVHISELADKEVEKVEDILKVGQAATFRVIKVSAEERKLGLSLKPAREATEQPHREPAEQQQQREPREVKPRSNNDEARKPRRQTEEKPVVAAAPKQHHQRDVSSSQGSSSGTLKSSLQQALEDHAARSKNKSE